MHLYTPDLLLPYRHATWRTTTQPQTQLWEQSDSEYLYTTNQRVQSDRWYYNNHDVTYIWNTNGYRAPEWATVDWSHTWIIMGCSLVVGVGLAFEDTLAERLAPLLEAPVVNLGMGGAGVDVMMYNSLRLLDSGIRPRGVILVTPELTRMTYWHMDCPVNCLAQGLDHIEPARVQDTYRGYMSYPPHAELSGYMRLRGLEALWQGHTPTHTAYWTKPSDAGLAHGLHLPPQQDWARDVNTQNGVITGHPGRLTMAHWARALAEVIQSS